MGWKNIRLIDDVGGASVFGTMDLYEDGCLRIHTDPTITDKVVSSAKTVKKHPGFFISLAGGFVKAAMGMSTTSTAYSLSRKSEGIGTTYREEKKSAETTIFLISNVYHLEAIPNLRILTVSLSGEGLHYTIYFPYASDVESFMEEFKSKESRDQLV